MDVPFFGRRDRRRLYDIAFEPDGEGFLFYRHRWAGGVPVTADEREAYLAMPVFGSRRGFYKMLKGRPVGARRDGRRTTARIAAVTPMIWLQLAVGCILVLANLAAGHDWHRWFALGAGAVCLAVGLRLSLARLRGVPGGSANAAPRSTDR